MKDELDRENQTKQPMEVACSIDAAQGFHDPQRPSLIVEFLRQAGDDQDEEADQHDKMLNSSNERKTNEHSGIFCVSTHRGYLDDPYNGNDEPKDEWPGLPT